MPDIVPAGFEEYYEKDYRALVAFARRLGADLADAEDAVQTSYGHLLIAWPQVDEPAAWMRRVVSRQVRRILSRPWTWPLKWLEHWRPAERPEPDERDRVLQLLRRLPEDEMTVLAWEIDGYTIGETAEYTDMTEADVRNARRRARGRLVQLMKEH
jgi:DNA-directed RNA polymerase specialized sigma24 family protein